MLSRKTKSEVYVQPLKGTAAPKSGYWGSGDAELVYDVCMVEVKKSQSPFGAVNLFDIMIMLKTKYQK